MCERLQLGHPIETLKAVTTPDMVSKCQESVRSVQVSSDVCDRILQYVQQTRSHPSLLLGASPRGSLGLFRASQALTAIAGEDSVRSETVDGLAPMVLAHRLILQSKEKDQGTLPEALVRQLVGARQE